MTVPHQRKPVRIDSNQFYVGEVPASGAGSALQKNYIYCCNWEERLIAAYSGRCDESINGSTTKTKKRKFHIVTGSPVRTDTADRQLCVAVKLWAKNYGAVTRTWRWFPAFDTGSPETLKSETLFAFASDDTQNDYPGGGDYLFPLTEGHCQYTPVATGTNDGFVCSAIDIDYALVSALSVWQMPIDPITATQSRGVVSANFSEEQTLRGYDSDEGTSVGAIAEYMNTADNDSMIHNTRRCLFQTPYPICAYANGDGAGVLTWKSLRADSAGNAQTYKVKPRNLTGGAADIDCLPAMVLGNTTADTIIVRFSSSVAGDKWEYTQSGALGADTLITPSDGTGSTGTGLMIDPGGDYVKIEVKASRGAEAYVKTVSLWEPANI